MELTLSFRQIHRNEDKEKEDQVMNIDNLRRILRSLEERDAIEDVNNLLSVSSGYLQFKDPYVSFLMFLLFEELHVDGQCGISNFSFSKDAKEITDQDMDNADVRELLSIMTIAKELTRDY